jgi:hypothetical protein
VVLYEWVWAEDCRPSDHVRVSCRDRDYQLKGARMKGTVVTNHSIQVIFQSLLSYDQSIHVNNQSIYKSMSLLIGD